MKNIFIFLFHIFTMVLLYLSLNVRAQVPTWSWAKSTYGTFDVHMACSMCVDLKGCSYITGYFGDSVITFDTISLKRKGAYDMFLAKFNSQGNILWVKHYFNGSGVSLKIDKDQNINVLCCFDSLIWNYQRSVFVAKFDTLGNLLGVKQLFAVQSSGNYYSPSFAIDNDGNYFLSGDFSDTLHIGNFNLVPFNSTSGFLNFFVAKFDSTGNVIWAHEYGNFCGCQQMGLSVDNNSNVNLIGSYCSSGNIVFGNDTLSGGHFFITKFDSSGNVIWAKSPKGYSTGQFPSITFCICDSLKNVLITGHGPGIFGNDTISIQGPYVLKYDFWGNVRWVRNLTNNNNLVGTTISIDSSNNIYIGVVNPFHNSSNSYVFGNDTIWNSDIFISKCDSSGNTIWTNGAGHFRNSNNGGVGLTSLQVDYSGNYLIVNGGYDADTARFGNTIFNFLYPAYGLGEIYLAKLIINSYTGVISYYEENESVVFPNPSKSEFHIRFPNKTVKVEIFNLFGNKILYKDIHGENKISFHCQLDGVYFVKIYYKDRFEVKKIIIKQ